MIRVRLRSGQHQARRLARLVAAAVVAAAVVAAATLGILFLVDSHYPLARAWSRLTGPATATGTDGYGRAEGASGGVPTLEEPAAPEPPPAAPEPARAEAMAAAAPPAEADPSHPYSSPACSRALALPRHLPSGIQLTSLTGRADGDYALEGQVPADGVAELLTALDALPSEARLSYWRGGRLRAAPYYKFIFDGRLPAEPRSRLSAVDDSRVSALADEVSRRARHHGLQGMHLDEPVDVALGPGRLHRRYKCWATGAVAQIRAFVSELGSLGESLAVGELLVVPAQGRQGPGPASAQLYAALDLVVAAPTAPRNTATHP